LSPPAGDQAFNRWALEEILHTEIITAFSFFVRTWCSLLLLHENSFSNSGHIASCLWAFGCAVFSPWRISLPPHSLLCIPQILDQPVLAPGSLPSSPVKVDALHMFLNNFSTFLLTIYYKYCFIYVPIPILDITPVEGRDRGYINHICKLDIQ
jgi:hypothetical protein